MVFTNLVRLCVPFSIGLVVSAAVHPQENLQRPSLDPLVSVTHGEQSGDPDSLAAPTVVQVQSLLDPVLDALPAGSSAVDAVQDALRKAFGADARLESNQLGYKTVYCWELMEWILVCCNAAVYRIDFGTAGTVLVSVEDRWIL